MLDLNCLRGITLHATPIAQKFIGSLFLWPNYALPPRVKIRVEGAERLPEEPAVLAMNHTDRYNYWPFQYWLWREKARFTATWVKGKYYENLWLGKFMEMMNSIPAPSKGYVMVRDFLTMTGRRPSDDEYAALRDLSEGRPVEPGRLPETIISRPRDMLGRLFDPSHESYAEALAALMADLNEAFIALNRQAFDKGLHLLIFPEGTRSRQLAKGRIGAVQAALRFRRAIVPIGCNGSDKLYPGNSPWARSGVVTYRIGEPMPYDSFAEHHLPEGLDPFDPAVVEEHRDRMQGLIDKVMVRIEALVDPEYLPSQDAESDGVTGARRFV